MLTTTPFFSPREGCEPKPISSIAPSLVSSPTSATTFEVPMSRPTTKLRSERLAIRFTFLCMIERGRLGGACAPADRKTVRVTHVDIRNVGGALADQVQRHRQETLEALIDLTPSEAHRHAVVELELPGAARIEAERAQAHAGLDDASLHRKIARHH